MKELFFNLCVFYMETYNIIIQHLIKNNIVRCVFINLLIQYINLMIYKYYSDEDICKIKSIVKFKNTSENARGRGINTDNSPTETHPPL